MPSHLNHQRKEETKGSNNRAVKLTSDITSDKLMSSEAMLSRFGVYSLLSQIQR